MKAQSNDDYTCNSLNNVSERVYLCNTTHNISGMEIGEVFPS